MNKISQILFTITILGVLLFESSLYANTYLEGEEAYLQSLEGAQEIEYNQKDMCVDVLGKCLDNEKVKIVEGIAVERDCWKYEYVKKCNNVPSKDNCAFIQQDDFKFVGDTCIAKTKIGKKDFCVNVRKTFAKTTYQKDKIDHSKIIMDPDDQSAVKELMCKSFCLDGSCVEEHKVKHENNDEIAEAIAQLEMLTGIKKGLVDANSLKFDIFAGSAMHCHNKTSIHSNCCNESGWLKSAGLVKCPVQVRQLASEVRKGKCEYVGEYCAKKEKITGICLRKTKTYCCYPSVLAKTIHRGARSQLGKNLGSAEHPRCVGLSINDIEAIDFSKVDFQEFYNLEVQPMMRGYNSEDNKELIKRSFPSGGSSTKPNSFSTPNTNGINQKLNNGSSLGDR